MKYEVIETPIINYEIKDEEGNLLGDVFETKQEAESYMQSLNKNPCKVSFYKTKSRGDKRFSISGIKKEAAEGDTVAIQKNSEGALVINVSKRAFK